MRVLVRVNVGVGVIAFAHIPQERHAPFLSKQLQIHFFL